MMLALVHNLRTPVAAMDMALDLLPSQEFLKHNDEVNLNDIKSFIGDMRVVNERLKMMVESSMYYFNAAFDTSNESDGFDYGLECDIFHVVERVRASTDTMAYSELVSIEVDRSSFQSNVHVGFPDLCFLIMITFVTTAVASSLKLNIKVSFNSELTGSLVEHGVLSIVFNFCKNDNLPNLRSRLY